MSSCFKSQRKTRLQVRIAILVSASMRSSGCNSVSVRPDTSSDTILFGQTQAKYDVICFQTAVFSKDKQLISAESEN